MIPKQYYSLKKKKEKEQENACIPSFSQQAVIRQFKAKRIQSERALCASKLFYFFQLYQSV